MNWKRHLSFTRTLAVLFAALALAIACPALYAGEGDGSESTNVVVFGGQYTDVDAEEGRDAKFFRNSDWPSGIVLDFLHWGYSNDNNWFQIKAWDVTQQDQLIVLRGGIGDNLKLRGEYAELPYRYGDGARFVLGRAGTNGFGPVYRIGDFIQQTMQDPDGNGIPFFTDAGETARDNAIVNSFTNQLLTGTDTFSLESNRRKGGGGFTYDVTDHWAIDMDITQELRDGNQALGTGTYQRITDVNADGIGDYDYFFSARGIEIPADIDYRTTRFQMGTGYVKDKLFFNVDWTLSDFNNEFIGITYDNPFWLNGIDATSGSRRGLWEEGRTSLEPSNRAWDLAFTGGVDLAHNTRITGGLSFGNHSQDVQLLPITTNPALIGTADINRDGVVNALDDPTVPTSSIQGLPSTIGGNPVIGDSLDASSDTLSFHIGITTRPTDQLTLNGTFRSYDYEGQEGIQVIPARAEYIESHMLLDFKKDLILHVPLDFARRTLDLEAIYRFSKNFKLKGFYERKNYDYAQYADPDGNNSRDTGSRAVSGTGENIFGATAMFGYGGWLSGRFTAQTSSRNFDGVYTPGFDGELGTTRQYDIADRDRNSFDFQFDFMPTDPVTFGVGFRYLDDDYPESEFGLQNGKLKGLDFNLNYQATEKVNFYAYVDWAQSDYDMHLRTKCSNCSVPAGFAPWDVPNFDWTTNYEDTTTTFGAGVAFDVAEKTRLEIGAGYLKGQINQTTANPGLPVELNPGNPLFGQVAKVALGFDFPTQENKLFNSEVKLVHSFSNRISVGLWWLYEDFDLDDFQWDNLQPYGANFLTTDDATRYLFLDSRYGDYNANVVQAFMKLRF